MADKIFLCVSAAQATAGHWRSGKLAAVRVFANNQSGWADFAELLRQNTGIPVYLLVDTVEEDYRFENLPHSFGSDRREMIARKLRQLYRNNPYSRAWLQGRETDKRRDDRFLFAALTNSELIAGWTQAIEVQQAPLAGVYLLPMATRTLLKRFGLDSIPNLLLITQNSAGLRQSFFRGQKLRISRLTPIEQIEDEIHTAEYAEEIGNTRLYLAAVKVMPLDDPLSIVILDQDGSLMGLSQELVGQQSNILCQYFSRSEIIARLGLAPELLQISPDALYLHMLGEHQPHINLAPLEKTRAFWRYQARQGVFAIAAVAALVAVLWCGTNLFRQYEYREEMVETAQQTAQQQILYMEVTKQYPVAPTPAENLRSAVEIAQKIRQSVHSPELMYTVISRALDASPNVVLKSINWKYDKEGIDADTGTQRPALITGSGPKWEAGVIEAEIRPFNGDYRTAVASINSFVEKLRRDPTVAEATITQLPLNINPGTSLSGNTTDSREQTSSAPFKAALSLRPAP
jgi:hypothetical protein